MKVTKNINHGRVAITTPTDIRFTKLNVDRFSFTRYQQSAVIYHPTSSVSSSEYRCLTRRAHLVGPKLRTAVEGLAVLTDLCSHMVICAFSSHTRPTLHTIN